MIKDFLPVCRQDMEARGWDGVDFVYVIGDAYVDHPSFGHAIISRILEANNYRVGIISQPDWKNKKVLIFMENRDLDLSSALGIWIPWSIIIPCRKNDGTTMPLRREAFLENGPTMPQLSTAI